MNKYNQALLIVEDDATCQFIVEKAFLESGATRINVVPSTLEALEYLKGLGRYADRQRYPFPSFVLTELESPRVNAYTLLQELRKNPKWTAIPVVVYATDADPSSVRRCYELGARAYHNKRGSYAEMGKELTKLHRYWAGCEVPRAPTSPANS